MKRMGHCLDWPGWVSAEERPRLEQLAQTYLKYRRQRGIADNTRVEGILEGGEWRFNFVKGGDIILVAYGLDMLEEYLRIFTTGE